MITNCVLTHLYDSQTPVTLLSNTGEILIETALIVGISGNEFDIEDAYDQKRYFVLDAADAGYNPGLNQVCFNQFIRQI